MEGEKPQNTCEPVHVLGKGKGVQQLLYKKDNMQCTISDDQRKENKLKYILNKVKRIDFIKSSP